jgi:hypothetical protein
MGDLLNGECLLAGVFAVKESGGDPDGVGGGEVDLEGDLHRCDNIMKSYETRNPRIMGGD